MVSCKPTQTADSDKYINDLKQSKQSTILSVEQILSMLDVLSVTLPIL